MCYSRSNNSYIGLCLIQNLIFFEKPLLPPLYKRQQLPEGLPLTQVSVSSEISSSGAPRARAEPHT